MHFHYAVSTITTSEDVSHYRKIFKFILSFAFSIIFNQQQAMQLQSINNENWREKHKYSFLRAKWTDKTILKWFIECVDCTNLSRKRILYLFEYVVIEAGAVYESALFGSCSVKVGVSCPHVKKTNPLYSAWNYCIEFVIKIM